VDEGGRIVGRTDGVTATQARTLKASAFGWAKLWHNQGGKLDLDDSGNPVPVSPKELLGKLVNEGGIPYDLAVRQLARWTPAARQWHKQGVNVLTGQSTRASTTRPTAYTPQETKAIQVALRAGPESGARYVFGAAGPNAYDCSGYTLRMVQQTTGITLPHQARAQFYDPRGVSVARQDLRPGDLVFFQSSPNGQGDGPPYHVGYYIGNGKYVEYYSRGKPARVSSLSSRSDYMGARRFGGVRA
jgi:cell wall-associated NlpC family hydrolase